MVGVLLSDDSKANMSLWKTKSMQQLEKWLTETHSPFSFTVDFVHGYFWADENEPLTQTLIAKGNTVLTENNKTDRELVPEKFMFLETKFRIHESFAEKVCLLEGFQMTTGNQGLCYGIRKTPHRESKSKGNCICIKDGFYEALAALQRLNPKLTENDLVYNIHLRPDNGDTYSSLFTEVKTTVIYIPTPYVDCTFRILAIDLEKNMQVLQNWLSYVQQCTCEK